LHMDIALNAYSNIRNVMAFVRHVEIVPVQSRLRSADMKAVLDLKFKSLKSILLIWKNA
jgi:hypothetical protein